MRVQEQTVGAPSKPPRLRRARARKVCSGEAQLELRDDQGNPRVVTAALLDVSDFGVGLETAVPLAVGSPVTVASRFFDQTAPKDTRRPGHIVHCQLRPDGAYRSGVCFDTEEKTEPASAWQEHVSQAVHGAFTDYYEVLQVSPRAGSEMIERAYRVMRERCSGQAASEKESTVWRLIDEAYRTLSNPEQRAAYDVRYRARSPYRRIFSLPSSGGAAEEKGIRLAILSALYTARKKQANQEGLSAKDLEELLVWPRESLEFNLWYLRGRSQVTVGGQGRYLITPQGADIVEAPKKQTSAAGPRLLKGA